VKSLCLALGLLAATGGARAYQTKPPPPPPPPPPIAQPGLEFRVLQADGDRLVGERTLVRYEAKVVVEKQLVDGKEVAVEKREFVPAEYRVRDVFELKDVRAFGADGKAVEAADLKKRLARPTGVLTTTSEKLAREAGLRALLKDDALILVLPPPEKR
jgi:hypothetical protein